ncbi:hypothetical protein ACFL96_14260 [Thermoproteota archaeon]
MGVFPVENKIACRNCGKKHPIETMQIDKYGALMVCQDCSKKQYKREPKRKVNKDGSVTELKAERGSLFYSNLKIMPRKEKEKEMVGMPHEMTAYKCTHCNYEFKRRKSFPFSGNCPYCNRNKVALDPIKSGQWVEKLWK